MGTDVNVIIFDLLKVGAYGWHHMKLNFSHYIGHSVVYSKTHLGSSEINRWTKTLHKFSVFGMVLQQLSTSRESSVVYVYYLPIECDLARTWTESGSSLSRNRPDSKFHGANMGPIWDRQDPGGPHVGPMNFAIWGTCDLSRAALFEIYHEGISPSMVNSTNTFPWYDFPGLPFRGRNQHSTTLLPYIHM